MPALLKRVQDFAHQHQLWQKGDKILIGISGGPDSVCLFRLMLELQPKMHFELALAHVNHGLRGGDSSGDESFVVNLGKKYRLPVYVLEKPKKIASSISEEKLRDIRYAYFEKTRKSLDFDLVAVAHNKNDQAETVMLRILRGTGLEGLSAMRPRREKLIRPLLGISRAEILLYLKTKKQTYRIDKTNSKNIYTRNLIRNTVLPLLEKKFGNKIVSHLACLAENSALDQAFLKKAAQQAAKKHLRISPTEISFSVRAYENMDPALKRHFLRLIFKKNSPTNSLPSANQLHEIDKLILSKKNKHGHTSLLGLKTTRKGDKIAILKL